MSLIRPTYCIESVSDINLEQLKKSGITCILLDRDNTCVPCDTSIIPPEVKAWFERAHQLGFKLCLVSNNFHTKQVAKSAQELRCDKVDRAMKPFPFAVWFAMKKMHAIRATTIFVGDQLFTDVLSARLADIPVILVNPQSTSDIWYTKILRKFESGIRRTSS